MASENKVIFYSEELNEDIYQNNKLLNSKKIILEDNQKEQINQTSYKTIVDSKDYLGCINNNCSAIKCECTNDKCDCNNVKHNSNHNSNHTNSNHTNSNHNNNVSNSKSNVEHNINNYITNLIDFLFIVLLVGLLIFIIYKRESLYLLYVLGITLLYIFIKFIMLSNL
jgi:ABC-type antimicrobial peptide transport system permease subunit